MNCVWADTDSSGFKRLLRLSEACFGWLVVAAHVVERRHNKRPVFGHDFEFAGGFYRAAFGENRMRDVLDAHLPPRRQQPATRYDVDHPLTLGCQDIECSAGNLGRREADSASRLQLMLELRRQTVVVGG